MNIEGWSKNHPLSVLMAGGACVIFGVLAFFELEIEELPSAGENTISILSELPGYPAQDIESLITTPLENNLSGIKNLREMESISTNSSSKIRLHPDWGADTYQTSIEVRECVDSIYPYLPSGMKRPIVDSSEKSGEKVIILVIKALRDESANAIYPILNNDIKMRFQGLEEVSYVSIQGLRKPEIHIDMDMDALSSRGLSISETASLLSSYLVKKSAGKILDNKLQRLVKVESGIKTAADIQNLQLFPGTRLDDIAEINESLESQDSFFLMNGEEAWGFCIYKKASSSTGETAESVRSLLSLLKEEYSDRFYFEIVDDQSVRITENVNSLFLSLFWGLAGVLVVLTILYRQFIPALITAGTIPLTLIVNFFFLYILKISINMVSLYGMIAAAGLIADNSIVVLHELERGKEIQRISSALFTSTLTTVIVFLPPLFIPGPTSVLFKDLILTVIMTISLSLPVSLFITPAFYRLLYLKKTCSSIFPGIIRNVQNPLNSGFTVLHKFSESSFRYGRFKYALLMLFFFTALIFLKFIPFDLFPERQSKKVLLTASIPAYFNSDEIKALAILSSMKLRDKYSFKTIVIESISSLESETILNFSPIQLDSEQQMNILIIQDSKISPAQQNDILSFCRDNLELPDACIQPLPGSFKRFISSQNGYNLTASDLETLYDLSLPPGLLDSRLYESDAYFFETDQQRLKVANIEPLSLHSDLTARLNGISAGELMNGAEKINILVRAADKYRTNIHSLNKAAIGEAAPALHLLGKFTTGKQRSAIYKINQKYIRNIISREERTTESIEAELVNSPAPGISIFRRNETQFVQLTYLYSFSLLLLFLVLGVQTGDLKKTVILFSTLIPALWGGLFLLIIFRQKLNIYGFLGLLIVQGTIINSGILLLSSIDESLKDGNTLQMGCRMRIEPLTGSCLSTVTALLPILFNSLHSGNGEAGMSITIIGGLLTGTMIMLFLLPVLYQSLVLNSGK